MYALGQGIMGQSIELMVLGVNMGFKSKVVVMVRSFQSSEAREVLAFSTTWEASFAKEAN